MHLNRSADPSKGILVLADPFHKSGWPEEIQKHHRNVTALIFHENERCLHRARSALWEVRRRSGWVCVAAEGSTAGMALSLAAQLPVDRVAIRSGTLFSGGVPLLKPPGLQRELARADVFARRNLSLVVAEILMIDSDERELRGLVRGLGHSRNVCSLHSQTAGVHPENWEELLQQPWDRDSQNRLRIPWKCV